MQRLCQVALRGQRARSAKEIGLLRLGEALAAIGPAVRYSGGRRKLGTILTKIALSLCVFALAGCAVFVCHPVTVTVANKKELARLETVPGAMRTTETGRLEEDVRQSRTVREYWVQTREGTWYRVSAEQFRAAEVGRALEICE